MRLLLTTAILCVIAVAGIELPTLFLPKRWLDIHPGQARHEVVSILGQPDADYFSAKSFDEWHNHFYVGASVLKVTYARDSDVVAGTDIRNSWGLAYRHWSRDYVKTSVRPR